MSHAQIKKISYIKLVLSFSYCWKLLGWYIVNCFNFF